MVPRHVGPLVRGLLRGFRIVYLTGPRQSGKTTLARSVAAELGMRYLTLDDPATRVAVASDPHGFVRSLEPLSAVLDEFQRVPELADAIKEASDRRASAPSPVAARKGLFLLAGSADVFRSARTREALPGHMARLELLPLSVAGLRGDRSNLVDDLLEGGLAVARPNGGASTAPTRDELAERILLGGYPEIQEMSPSGRARWFDSYVEGRLFKDFDALYSARGDYQSRIRVLLPYLAGLSGSVVKYARFANDLELNDKLAKSYVEVLDLLFLVRRIPSYRRNLARRSAVRMPKLHFVDTGLASHLLGLRRKARLLASAHYGALLESLVFMECAKHLEWAEEDVRMHHFRDKRKREVAIVLERADGRIVGVEVKASATIRRRDLDGLVALAESTGDAFERGVLFHGGTQALPFHRGRTRLHALPLGRIVPAASDPMKETP